MCFGLSKTDGVGEWFTDREHGNLISLLSFLQNKECWLVKWPWNGTLIGYSMSLHLWQWRLQSWEIWRHVIWLITFWMKLQLLPVPLNMEAASSSKTLVPTYQTTRYHDPQHHNITRHGHLNPKSRKCNVTRLCDVMRSFASTSKFIPVIKHIKIFTRTLKLWVKFCQLQITLYFEVVYVATEVWLSIESWNWTLPSEQVGKA